ncbi:pantetheine-phosphate adenylyltransferase [Actinobaculum massiliense]|uniref:pantetheine-phosphate adenylyltransferase n=1 Tax=Actinobaculum massiliense TaxID=202789 RepID=UPI00288B7942|nr:pantetheine-phosphate adenylyltransferase [Actinobaculum massiliense]
MSLAVCPGSFDPVTYGHLDIFERAAQMFDRVIIAVAHNASKKAVFTAEERIEFIRQSVGADPRIEVRGVEGLLVDFCADAGASAIVKGLRSGIDLDAEYPMALMNRELSGIETIFVLGDPAKGHIASSLVKDVALHGGDVSSFVPGCVARALEERYA